MTHEQKLLLMRVIEEAASENRIGSIKKALEYLIEDAPKPNRKDFTITHSGRANFYQTIYFAEYRRPLTDDERCVKTCIGKYGVDVTPLGFTCDENDNRVFTTVFS